MYYNIDLISNSRPLKFEILLLKLLNPKEIILQLMSQKRWKNNERSPARNIRSSTTRYVCFAENIINTTILPILILQWFPTWKKKKTIKTKPFVVNFPTAYYFLGYASPSWEASTDNKCWHLSCHVSLLSFLRQKKIN